jgi:hypothetical protein
VFFVLLRSVAASADVMLLSNASTVQHIHTCHTQTLGSTYGLSTVKLLRIMLTHIGGWVGLLNELLVHCSVSVRCAAAVIAAGQSFSKQIAC